MIFYHSMDSAELINHLCSILPTPSYLEIGLSHATTFAKVEAAEKTGVDPEFHFDPHSFSDRSVIALHQSTSDEFFSSTPLRHYDTIFIDGLHTADQVLKDFANSLTRLKRNGFIVIDDILPNDYLSTLEDQSQTYALREAYPHISDDRRYDWHGSVFKALPTICSLYARLNIFLVINGIENPKAIICHRDNAFTAHKADLNRLSVATLMHKRWDHLCMPSSISYADWLSFLSTVPAEALDTGSVVRLITANNTNVGW